MPKILIVDDDWLTILEIERMLTNLGYDVAGKAETGVEAVAMARELNPDLIFMDVKMPGEMNGIDAAREIKAELGTPIVFISGYCDPEHIEAAKEITPFGYVMKPFDEREVHAFVEIALSRRKLELKLEEAHDELERRVESRTAELEKANKQLQEENEARKRIEEALRESEKDLKGKGIRLEELNSALKILLEKGEKDREDLEEKVMVNVKEMVLPYVAKLKSTGLDAMQETFAGIIESNLDAIVSPFLKKLSSKYLNLTPTEIRVADLVKQGLSTKEIGRLLNSSPETISRHRKRIRKKLQLKDKKSNLRTHLLSLQ